MRASVVSTAYCQPKECLRRENLDCFWRKTQLLPSGPKGKCYSIPVLAFFMGLPWNFDPIFYMYIFAGNTMPQKKSSPFGALE